MTERLMASEREALVARVRGELCRCTIPCEQGCIANVSVNDLRALCAEVERLREDAARLDWLEQNAGRVSGPAADSPRFVIWGDTDATDAVGDTLRETIDAARTTGGRDA